MGFILLLRKNWLRGSDRLLRGYGLIGRDTRDRIETERSISLLEQAGALERAITVGEAVLAAMLGQDLGAGS
jgi:hypothetical protein